MPENWREGHDAGVDGPAMPAPMIATRGATASALTPTALTSSVLAAAESGAHGKPKLMRPWSERKS